MSKDNREHIIELINARFYYKVNNGFAEVWFNDKNRTIVLFRGVTVYTSKMVCTTEKQAEEVIRRYLDSIK